MDYNTNKVFFTPGDVVKVKHEIDNRPTMIVKTIDKVTIRNKEAGDRPTLFGITCFWFSTDGKIQEARFNTKDLIHI